MFSMKQRIPAAITVSLLALTMGACGQDSANPAETTVVTTTTPAQETSQATATTTVTETSQVEETTTEVATETTKEEPESTEPEPSGEKASQCDATKLSIELERGDSAAGHTSYLLVFRNDGEVACQLLGYPKVMAVGASSKEIGSPAEQDLSMKPRPVMLEPGKSQKARLIAVNIGSNGGPLGAKCKAVDAGGFMVVPPGGGHGLYAKGEGLSACSGEVNWLKVQPVGTGE